MYNQAILQIGYHQCAWWGIVGNESGKWAKKQEAWDGLVVRENNEENHPSPCLGLLLAVLCFLLVKCTPHDPPLICLVPRQNAEGAKPNVAFLIQKMGFLIVYFNQMNYFNVTSNSRYNRAYHIGCKGYFSVYVLKFLLYIYIYIQGTLFTIVVIYIYI